MKRPVAIQHEFVDAIPEVLGGRVLYVSIKFATAVHACFCGCGSEVVTPLSPADWTLIFDGRTVSLTPSVGSWQLPCRSHYWIRRNTVVWAAQWSRKRVDAANLQDARMRSDYFDRAQSRPDSLEATTRPDADVSRTKGESTASKE